MNDSTRRWRASRRPCWAPGRAVMRHCTQSSEAFSGRRINVSMPHIQAELDLFKLSKQVSFDGARRIPMLRQMNHANAMWSHYVCVLIPPYRSSLGESLGAPPCVARGAGRGTAVTSWQGGGRVHGPSTLREGLPRQNECCEEARLQEAYCVHDAPEDTNERWRGYMEVCAPNVTSDARVPKRSGLNTNASPQSENHCWSACMVRYCRGLCCRRMSNQKSLKLKTGK